VTAERDRCCARRGVVGTAGLPSSPAPAAGGGANDHRGKRTATRGDKALEKEHGDLRRYSRPRWISRISTLSSTRAPRRNTRLTISRARFLRRFSTTPSA